MNGVCHQAANRILFPAGVTVHRARGYWVSEALYGTYGRPRGALGLCQAPFHQHPSVSGDLPECLRPSGATGNEIDVAAEEMRLYLRRVTSAYETLQTPWLSADMLFETTKRFQLHLFSLLMEFKLGFENIGQQRQLMALRSTLEDGAS